MELRAMVALAVPVVLSELGWMAQGVVDTIMVGRLGPAAIGAVALGNAVCYTPSLFGVGLMLGLDTLVAQAYGRKDHDDAIAGWRRACIWRCCDAAGHDGGLAGELWLCALRNCRGGGRAGGELSARSELGHAAAAALWSDAALSAGRGPGTGDYGDLCGGEPGELVRQLGADLRQVGLAGAGRERIGDFDGDRAGVMAVALMGFAWRYERRRGHPLFRHWAAPHVDALKRLVRLGAPAAGQILLEVGAWNLATFSAGYLTPVALATHQIVLNYASLTYMVPLGISAAAAVSVGHAVGAGDQARARRAGWLALGLGTSFMLLAAMVFLVRRGR